MNTYIREAGKKKEKERTRERERKKEKEGDKVLIYNISGERRQDIGQEIVYHFLNGSSSQHPNFMSFPSNPCFRW